MKKYLTAGVIFFINALELGLILAASKPETVYSVLVFGLMVSLLITGLCTFAVYTVLNDRVRVKRKARNHFTNSNNRVYKVVK